MYKKKWLLNFGYTQTKFGLSDEEVAQILFDFSTFTLPIEASRKIRVIDDDPDDDKFIECAVASRAGFIVSGDKHLLNLKEYKERGQNNFPNSSKK